MPFGELRSTFLFCANSDAVGECKRDKILVDITEDVIEQQLELVLRGVWDPEDSLSMSCIMLKSSPESSFESQFESYDISSELKSALVDTV